ncbi:MAG: glycosyltransferase family 2 protein [Anaerolineae bacterium]|jgi:glycosyltransferase involved in cell wall biosynthesis|nr:glycosyltransferase family 2 protein [Anaerolineae bacterium]
MVKQKVKPDLLEGEPRVVAIIPAYNEARTIGSVVLQTCRHADTVIVVDDGSSDATAEIAAAAGALVVRHGVNRGKGAALNTGFCKARELDPLAIVMLDGDGQHQPEEVPQVLAPILEGQADMVVGSRYLEKECGVPRHRILGHWAFTSLTNLASGLRVSDSQSGFRAFSPRAVECVSFSSNGFSVESEMQFLAHEHGLRLAEVPITADYVDKPKRPVVAHGLMVLNGVLRLVGQYRPLFFFGLAGLFLLLVGTGWGWWVVVVYGRTKQLAVGYALISVLLTVLGSLSLFSGIMLHSVRALLMEFGAPRDGRALQG